MEKVWVAGTPPLWEYHHSGLRYCPGCQHPILQRLLLEVMGEMGIAGRCIGVAGVGCNHRIFHEMKIDSMNCAHGRAPDVATGLKRAHHGWPLVFTVQGDGDCIAIGAGSLLNAAVRAEKITVIMANNVNYGTTGGQLAPTTLVGQVTTTTPEGRDPKVFGYPVHVPELLSTIQGVVYTARSALTSPANYQRTKTYLRAAFQKQLDGVGFGLVEIMTTCPTDWHMTPLESLKFVEEKMIPEFPLGEFKNTGGPD